jgi:hypothetical protein
MDDKFNLSDAERKEAEKFLKDWNDPGLDIYADRMAAEFGIPPSVSFPTCNHAQCRL